MKKILLALALIAVFLASACSAVAPEATPTPLPTATFTPPPTATATAEPTITNTPLPPTPTEDPIANLVPSGDPATEWEGIPIMPGALAGQADGADSYTFSIRAVPEDVQAFYEQKLQQLGYAAFATGTSNAGQPVLLIFMKGDATLTLSIIPYGDQLIVTLVK